MRYKKGQFDRNKPKIDLEVIKQSMIEQSKTLLQEYLQNNPLLSYAKYEDGRYYTVTQEKQQQLTSKLFMATIKALNREVYALTWNDTGNICEEWTLEELTQLSEEIDDFVTDKVTKQQHIEVVIRNATTLEELESIVINYED